MAQQREAAWSKLIEESGVQVRLFERGGKIYRDVALGRTVSESGKARTKHDVRSMGHSDRKLAEKQARSLAKEIARGRLNGHVPDGRLTLGQLFTAYRLHRLPTLSKPRQREAQTRMAMFLDAWGAGLPVQDVDQTRVMAYSAARRALRVVAPGLRITEDGARRRGYRKPQPVRDGALDGEFRFLNSVLNWACGFKSQGRPLLQTNPLPIRGKDRRALGWPVEKNPRRPVAAHDRYTATQKHTDTIDPDGRLRAILALARFTARRESAICALYASDLLFSPERIRAALADAGRNEADGEHMQHGAIRWRDVEDKQGLLFITPIGAEARAELDRYQRRAARVGDVPLFPAPGRKPKRDAKPNEKRAPEKPISRDTAAKWLVRAEQLAGMPKLRGGVFHPYRRLWAIERRHLPSLDVAAAGGWSDDQALRLIYQRAQPDGVARAVSLG